jgi:predicted small secreted protein
MKNMSSFAKRLLLTAVFLAVASTWFGCHTAHGFGEDVERTGEKIQEKTPP